jgi:type IV secretion system protein VirD4
VILWLTDQPGEEKTLARLSEILNRSRKSFTMEFVTKMAASKAFEGAIKKLASPFLDMPDTTYGGVMGHIAEATAFLADPRILVATKISSFSMADLTGAGKDRPTTIYLVVPLDRIAVQKTWLRLMITSALSVFKHKPPGARYRCMFLIDEFPALGKVDDMSTNIATLRKSGVDCTLVVQGLSKLKELYGNLADDIVGNCSYKWFCNVNDLQSAEYLSKTLGQKTIRTTTTGENKNTSRNPGGQSQSEGENVGYAEAARWLLTPDEVINLGSDAAILLAPNSRPHYLRPIDYWDLQEAFSEFQKQYPHLYWPLYYDRNAALDPSVPQYPPHPPPAPGTITPPSASGASAYDPTLYARNPDAQQSQGPNKPAGKPIDLTLYAPKPNAQQPQEPKKPAGKPIDLTLYAPKPKGKPEGKDGS